MTSAYTTGFAIRENTSEKFITPVTGALRLTIPGPVPVMLSLG